jgi:hypothetical protein
MWITAEIIFTYAENPPPGLWRKLWISPSILWIDCG